MLRACRAAISKAYKPAHHDASFLLYTIAPSVFPKNMMRKPGPSVREVQQF